MAKQASGIAQSVHPEYAARYLDWDKFRYITEGGDSFIEKYVQQFSTAEDPTDFDNRKTITPVAGFAKAAIKDVNNAIFQRMHAIRRSDGTESWRKAVSGQIGGVDLNGSTMNHFIGTEILPELLSMGKVGIYVDNFKIETPRTKLEAGLQHPYIYSYKTEDIRNWEYYIKGETLHLKRLLLRVYEEVLDPVINLAGGYNEFFRYYWMEDGVVLCQQYNDTGEPINEYFEPTELSPIELKINEIPFVILELQASLLTDIANHQIALTNMESADIGFVLRSNIPFYTEQYDQRFETAAALSQDDDKTAASGDNTKTRKMGATDGVRYPMGAERPGFIHPSPEPLSVSMQKQTNLKDDIRTLANLAVANTRSRFASAESKQMDERGLESGLSAIGLVLEHAEAKVAKLWSEYESSTATITVKYPERYSLKSDEERRKDAEQLARTAVDVSSHTFRKEIHKEIAETLLAGKISDETLVKIRQEIDNSDYPSSNPEHISTDVELGLCSREFASVARGYPKGEAEKAKKEKLESDLARMQSQTKGFENPAARGLDHDPQAAKEEKEESQENPDGKKLVRGEDKGERKIPE
jgi:hypothetical protein